MGCLRVCFNREPVAEVLGAEGSAGAGQEGPGGEALGIDTSSMRPLQGGIETPKASPIILKQREMYDFKPLIFFRCSRRK